MEVSSEAGNAEERIGMQRASLPRHVQTRVERPDTASRSVLQDLLEAPFEFDFDAAVAILRKAVLREKLPAVIQFEAASGLAFASSDVLAVARDGENAFRMVTGFLGLTGPARVLPRVYTEHVVAERRQRSSALADFLNLMAQRPMTQFAAAATKYRPHRVREEAFLDSDREDELRATLMAFTGHVIPTVARALGPVLESVLHHAGAFAAHPRSAERLAAMLSDTFDRPVIVQQFVGRWNSLDLTERTSMPQAGRGGRFHQLGVDAAVGTAFWDIQSRIVIRIGPLSLEDFEAFLPGGRALTLLQKLACAYLDDAVEFAVNPVLAASEVPPLELSERVQDAARLGLNTWLTAGTPRQRDADDALIHADVRGHGPAS